MLADSTTRPLIGRANRNRETDCCLAQYTRGTLSTHVSDVYQRFREICLSLSETSEITVAAYVGKHGWINMDARDPVDWDHVRELVLESYCLNAPKRLAKQVAPGT